MSIILRKRANCRNQKNGFGATVLIVASIVGVLFWGDRPEQAHGQVDGQQAQQVEDPTAPRRILVTSKDGVNLACTYFPPIYRAPPDQEVKPNADPPAGWGKSVIPWILVHDWRGSGQDLIPYASELQRRGGHAVIVPDLRGHGESVTIVGSVEEIDIEKFRRPELMAVVNDIEACKKQLVQFHNEEALNIDLLCLVSIGKSSAVAMTWVISDWYAYPPFGGGVKQGQDVKVLVMISPERSLEAWTLGNPVLRHPMFAGRNPQIPNLPTFIAWSENDETAARESEAIFNSMKRGRPDTDHIEDADQWREATTLYSQIIPRVRLSGTELIRQNASLRESILRFVDAKVLEKIENYPWSSRVRK